MKREAGLGSPHPCPPEARLPLCKMKPYNVSPLTPGQGGSGLLVLTTAKLTGLRAMLLGSQLYYVTLSLPSQNTSHRWFIPA